MSQTYRLGVLTMSKMKFSLKKTMKIFLEGLFFLFVLLIAYFSITGVIYRNNPKEVPMPLGFNMFTVLTGSMQPYLSQGDKVIIVKTDVEKLQIGDVISFQNEGMLVTHRIVEINKDNNDWTFQTKGDYNNANDRFLLSSDQIVGKVAFRLVPMNFIQKHFTPRHLILLAGFGFVVAIFYVTYLYLNRKRQY